MLCEANRQQLRVSSCGISQHAPESHLVSSRATEGNAVSFSSCGQSQSILWFRKGNPFILGDIQQVCRNKGNSAGHLKHLFSVWSSLPSASFLSLSASFCNGSPPYFFYWRGVLSLLERLFAKSTCPLHLLLWEDFQRVIVLQVQTNCSFSSSNNTSNDGWLWAVCCHNCKSQ